MKRAVVPIVLFDGVCRFCNAGVNFLIDRDPKARLRFAALQSPTGQGLLKKFGLRTTRFDTLVLVEGDHCYVRSTAAIRIAAHLDGFWWLTSGALFVPSFLRDFAYDVLARNRYRWFGTLDACRVPTPEVRSRFLDQPGGSRRSHRSNSSPAASTRACTRRRASSS
jgi:predicted DCC family thiol-disulfide oxidoreductase YuxK